MLQNKPYFIAEISANHLGQLSRAKELIKRAAAAGADAVKLQTYSPDSMTLNLDSPQFRVSEQHTLWGGRKLYDLYEEAQTPRSWHPILFDLANEQGLDAFSTPFDEESVDYLNDLGVPAFKVASLEIIDHPLLERIASKKKPVLLSTGAASLSEIATAVGILMDAGASEVVPLVCTSAYPASASDANLRRLQTLRSAFGSEVGLSDHTLGLGVAVAAVALGAGVIEKHLTLDRAHGGPDSAFSLNPTEFGDMVTAGREAHMALGSSSFQSRSSEAESVRLRPSLWVIKDVTQGEPVTTSNVASMRPSGGLRPRHFREVLTREFNQSIPAGTALDWSLLA